MIAVRIIFLNASTLIPFVKYKCITTVVIEPKIKYTACEIIASVIKRYYDSLLLANAFPLISRCRDIVDYKIVCVSPFLNRFREGAIERDIRKEVIIRYEAILVIAEAEGRCC